MKLVFVMDFRSIGIASSKIIIAYFLISVNTFLGGVHLIFENIEALCKSRGTNLSRLERDVGLSNATIRRWASSSPSVDNLKLVADYFGVTIDELMRDKTSA